MIGVARGGLNLAIELQKTLPLRPVRVIEMLTERSPAGTGQSAEITQCVWIFCTISRRYRSRSKFRIIVCQVSESVCCHVRVPSANLIVKATVTRRAVAFEPDGTMPGTASEYARGGAETASGNT